MKKKTKGKKKTKKRRWPIVLLVLCVYIISSGVSFTLLKDKFAFESTFISEIEARQALSKHKKNLKQSGRLYENMGSAPSVEKGGVKGKERMLVLAEDTINTLLAQYDARLLDLYLDREGVIYMDFSDDLKKNYHMDISQELNFLSSLFNGIRSSVPRLKAMKILIEGKELESLGGHIDISKPIGAEIAGFIR